MIRIARKIAHPSILTITTGKVSVTAKQGETRGRPAKFPWATMNVYPIPSNPVIPIMRKSFSVLGTDQTWLRTPAGLVAPLMLVMLKAFAAGVLPNT
jgi:hypothetical protein